MYGLLTITSLYIKPEYEEAFDIGDEKNERVPLEWFNKYNAMIDMGHICGVEEAKGLPEACIVFTTFQTFTVLADYSTMCSVWKEFVDGAEKTILLKNLQ